ncbi:MAG: RNA polymerase sigma factor SigZ [Pelagimonas sp.]|jgi:RNA polymerase sigma-70 factor (ECF subfamily)|nr:RNA polymerase sigma factor SigZ [Pelagimonas sp.]
MSAAPHAPNVTDIWRAYETRLRRFLAKRVSNPADAEDLLQDIMLRVTRGLCDLGDQDSLQAWLFRIARNAITDFYRQNARPDPHPDDLWHHADDPATRHELERCVAPFIDGLPKPQATLLRAIDLEGRSQKDQAQALGIPYSTLKTRVQTARSALRHSFETCCAFERDRRGGLMSFDAKSKACKKC